MEQKPVKGFKKQVLLLLLDYKQLWALEIGRSDDSKMVLSSKIKNIFQVYKLIMDHVEYPGESKKSKVPTKLTK